MRRRKIKVGDVLTVRQWDDMAKEYPLTPYGSIDGEYNTFVDGMRIYCGKQVTIKKVHCTSQGTPVEFSIMEDDDEWIWCYWMFEQTNKKELHQPSHKDLSSLLFE